MKFWIYATSAAALLISGSAFAADLRMAPPPAPLAPLPAFTWAGFYLGGDVGGAWATDKLTESTALVPPRTGSATLDSSGVIGGAHVGYNWQVANWVFGLEGDFDGTSLKKNGNCLVEDAGAGNLAPGACFPQTSVGTGYAFSTELPWQASIRGRLGYAFGNALLYATGGVAFADIKTSYSNFGGATPGTQSFDQTRAGFTVGGGIEYALNANWSARVEYRYSDFGKLSNTLTAAGAFWNGYTDKHRVTENLVMVGISYKFGAPAAPVVARY